MRIARVFLILLRLMGLHSMFTTALYIKPKWNLNSKVFFLHSGSAVQNGSTERKFPMSSQSHVVSILH